MNIEIVFKPGQEDFVQGSFFFYKSISPGSFQIHLERFDEIRVQRTCQTGFVFCTDPFLDCDLDDGSSSNDRLTEFGLF